MNGRRSYLRALEVVRAMDSVITFLEYAATNEDDEARQSALKATMQLAISLKKMVERELGNIEQ